ncbi:MAG: DUF2971 domain-containing protein [Pseudomonadota bacterium]|nr:DUF2971 domain-containing protein [Pseudomonadota bacterium]
MTDEGRQHPFAPGGYLYHYTTMETLLQYVLPNGTIKLSPYASVRDPLEVKKHIEISPPPEAKFREMYAQVEARERAAARPGGQIDEESFRMHVGMVTKHMKRAAWELIMLVPRVWQNTYAHHVKVLCLTQDAPFEHDVERLFSFGYARPRMWEQYGDDHRGVCLCFHRGELLATLEREANGDHSLTSAVPAGAYRHDKVVYRRTGPDREALTAPLASVATDPWTGGPRGDDAYEFLVKHRDALWGELLFAKLDDWEGEREYRWVMLRRDDPNPVFIPYRTALKSIIVGEEFPGWAVPSLQALNTARRACGESIGPAALYRLRWDRQIPALRELPAAA